MRIEKDALGEMQIPDDAYYGIQTTRVTANYFVSDHSYNEYSEVIKAVAEVKKACARTNAQIHALAPHKAQAIEKACDEIIAGNFDGQFPVNIWRSQGTGVNMNVNEVIANRANEILTGHKGYDEIHPNSHVNMCQSSNDVFPTAEAIVFHRRTRRISEALKRLEKTLALKALEFESTVRLGRTGLQDAVPMTYGQVFGGWHSQIRRHRVSLESFRNTFEEGVLGATVLGTGMGQLPGYSDHIYENLSKIIGFEMHLAQMPGDEVIADSAVFDGMRNTDHQHVLMEHISAISTAMGRIANDLLLYSSGPRTGLCELILPEVNELLTNYAGTSCTYVPELVIEVMHQAIATEQMAMFAANEGQLDHGSINSGALISVLDVLTMVEDIIDIFSDKCIKEIQVNETLCRNNAELSTSLSTMVSSLFGYPVGLKIAKLAIAQNISCKEAALKENLIPTDVAENLFDVKKLTDRKAMVEMFRQYGKLRKIS